MTGVQTCALPIYASSDKLAVSVETHRVYIQSETLAVEMDGSHIPDRLPNLSDEFDGETLTVWLEKV